jgi:octaprenyl-diphosphate synthase
MKQAAVDYAVALGMAFQVRDDILDYCGSESSVGKALGVDIAEQKITLPLLGALSNVSDERASQVRDMVRDIVSHPENKEAIMSFVKDNGGVEYAEQSLVRYIDKAVAALSVFPDSTEKEYLVELAHFTAKRAK